MNKDLLKVKAKDYTGKWQEGYIVNLEVGGYAIVEDLYIFEDSSTNIFWTEIDPKTICISTGFKDKHGKIVYENDIVEVSFYHGMMGEIESRYKIIVKYDNEKGMFVGKDLNSGSEVYGYKLFDKNIEVVGNVLDYKKDTNANNI